MGITAGYPRLRRRFGKLMAYIQLCRFFTLLAPLVAGVLGVLTPVGDVTLREILTAVYVGVTLALAQACGQCLNQYADAELDKIIKPYRPVPSGQLSKEEALGLSWLLAIFAIGRGFTINIFFGLIVLTCLFFAVFYSLAPFSPRRVNPILNVTWMAVSRGLLPMFAVWSVYGNLAQAWKYSLLAFLIVFGLQSTKDVPDVEGDRLFKIKTVPNTYGLRGLVALMLGSGAVYTALCLLLRMYIMLLVVPLFVVAAFTTNKQTQYLENNISWLCFYSSLALIYVLVFVDQRFL